MDKAYANFSSLKVYNKLAKLLIGDEKKQALTLFCMTLFMALMDVAGVASILPFIAVLSNSEIVSTNFFLKEIYKYLNFSNTADFLFFLGLISLTLLILSLITKALTTYIQFKFALMKEYTIGKKLFELYLNQPYSHLINRDNADLSKLILSEVGAVTHGGILQLVIAISQTSVIIALVLMLSYVDPLATLTVSLALLTSYLCIFYFTKPFL